MSYVKLLFVLWWSSCWSIKKKPP